MSAEPHDVAHLVALIEATKAEAARLGPGLGGVPGHLEQALIEARGLLARHCRADEGLRPEDLTTGNDR